MNRPVKTQFPPERRILTQLSSEADLRFAWCAFREGDSEVPEVWGFGRTADEATLDLYLREREELEAQFGWRSAG